MATALPGWGMFLNGGYQDAGAIGSPSGQAFINALRKYDPNAQWINSSSAGGEGGSGSDAQYTLQYDQSKLPSPPPGLDMNPGAFAALRNDPSAGYRGSLYVPDAINNDSFWGASTPRENVNNAANDRNLVDIIGPIVVAAATMGGGLAGLAPAMAGAGFDTAASGAFAASGAGTYGAGLGAAGYGGGGLSSMIQRLISNGPRTLGGVTGGGQSQPTLTPTQLMLLRLLAGRQQGGGG